MTSAYLLDKRSAWFQSGGFGWFIFVLYCGYALAFWYGTTLILQGHGAYIYRGLSNSRKVRSPSVLGIGDVGTLINV